MSYEIFPKLERRHFSYNGSQYFIIYYGENKPDTFDFLGFTHYCSKGNKYGNFRVKRKTSKKKFKQKVQEFKVWIKENRHRPLKEIITIVKKKLTGHFNYYGITDNYYMISKYNSVVIHLLNK